jgi:hypothetical protein
VGFTALPGRKPARPRTRLLSTTLSGDLDRNGTLDDGNACLVVTGSGVDVSAILDGFTITGGNANGSSCPYDRGGGMYNDSSSPTLTRDQFTNSAALAAECHNE